MDISKIKEIVKKPVFIGVAGVIIGLILGLVVGWGVWPVQWTDASAENLRPDLQRDFLRAAVLSFDVTGDQALALKTYQELGMNAELTLTEIGTDLGYLNTEQILKFSQAVGGESAVIDVPLEETETPEETGGSGSNIFLLGLICLGLLIAIAVVVYFFFIRKRIKPGSAPLSNVKKKKDTVVSATQVDTEDMSLPGQVKPIAQFMTTYMFGDDLYDDSFKIDTANGEFLGECGVGVSDIIGVGEPKKISAIEVWLFDKNDVQTVTKVFMSNHTFDKPAIRQKLESKGELVLAEPGKQILLETATLQLEVRIVDMSYGDIPLPESSYFQRFTLELAAWPK